MSADTIVPSPGNVLDWDRYQYVRSNPLKFVDPTGHAICDEEGNCFDKTGQTSFGRTKRDPEPPVLDSENEVDWSTRHIQHLYRILVRTSGWWNDFGVEILSVNDFFALMLSKELSPFIRGVAEPGPGWDRKTDFITDLAHGTAHWFYSQSAKNGYSKEPSDMAIFSFLAHGCSDSAMRLYNLIAGSGLTATSINKAMERREFNVPLGNTIMKAVITPQT